ncbi:MAG: beta-ketoacyl-[Paludibacteraceae bacterium]|nr:beta-ketoacyl-[acyl-carrier-protein] synthase family protein [Paludibacteraceae bacterium]
MSKVYITGAGVVSAIGCGKEETLKSLLDGKSGIGRMRYLKTEHKELPVGEVKMSNEELCKALELNPEEVHSRTKLLGIMALKEALEEAHISRHAESSEASRIQSEISLISGTTVGGMDITERSFMQSGYSKEHLCGATTNAIADYFGIFGRTITPSTACSSTLNAIILGCSMIKAGMADMVVAGGTEALTMFHLNGFNSLMILDKEPCRPFDATRAGLNLGEGAAYVVLESAESVKRRGVKPIGAVTGTANRCDAFHQTATSPEGEGATQSMLAALKEAGLKPEEIDYINAHGTATPNNDLTEIAAFRRVFGEQIPPFSSTKGLTGHTTSASGSIETVICLLAMQNGFIPASHNCLIPMDPAAVPVMQTVKNTSLHHVMCNSFGFGGNDSTIIVEN